MNDQISTPAGDAKTEELEFISLEEAAAMTSGTRVTFIPGIQAMYAEALKNICFVKEIPLIRAIHPMMGIDESTGLDRQAKLYELTSQTSLPTMFHNEERPRNVWVEQLALAEEIGAKDTPKLIPRDFKQRMEVIGLCALTVAEDGLVWNMRNLIDTPLGRKYGYNENASKEAPQKIGEIISLVDERLASQKAKDSKYLVGATVTAADIYWATMTMTVLSVPREIMPETRQNRGMLKYFEANSKIPEIADALTQQISDHQQYILSTYCETPAVLGGDPI